MTIETPYWEARKKEIEREYWRGVFKQCRYPLILLGLALILNAYYKYQESKSVGAAVKLSILSEVK
jgi:hypothetical protein